jgi:hypothetical protein
MRALISSDDPALHLGVCDQCGRPVARVCRKKSLNAR